MEANEKMCSKMRTLSERGSYRVNKQKKRFLLRLSSLFKLVPGPRRESSFPCFSPIMTSVPLVPEFRDQYLTNGQEIIRPKPRRLGDMNRQSCDVIPRSASREGLLGSPPLKFQQSKDFGGSAPVLLKTPSREHVPPTSLKPPAKDPPTPHSKVMTPKDAKLSPKDQSSSSNPQVVLLPSKAVSREVMPVSSGFCVPHGPTTPVRDVVLSPAKSSPGLFLPSTRVSPARVVVSSSSGDGGTALWDRHVIDEEDEGVTMSVFPYRDSNTDCGSLSKSSSDGDPIVFRKRLPGRLKSRRRNILSFPHIISPEDGRTYRHQECYGGSSSDDNRSSGHASMSETHSSCVSLSPVDHPAALGRPPKVFRCYDADGHNHGGLSSEPEVRVSRGSPLKSVPEDERLQISAAPKSGRRSAPASSSSRRSCTSNNHRGVPKDPEGISSFEGAHGIDDLRQAIEQLAVRNHSSRTSYSTSTYSSVSGASVESSADQAGSRSTRHLMRHSSLETINTTSAGDEFVWLDVHNRLVEPQHLPWSNHDVLRVLQGGRLKERLARISMETVPRLAYLLQRPLVRVTREAQRLARTLGVCGKREVGGALRLVLAPTLADSCVKACHRSAAIYAGAEQLRQSKSARAQLHFLVGRFHRWMCEVRAGTFVHEYAAIYMTAGMENLLEEIVLQCLPTDEKAVLSSTNLESAIATNGSLWGMLQPYSHLNSGRTANGALCLPSWPNHSEVVSRASSLVQLHQSEDQTRQPKTLEQNLLTTCVGTLGELGDLLSRVLQYYNRVLSANNSGRQNVSWSPSALHTLFYFMRCSQLERTEHHSASHQGHPVQELTYERPYLVLPPLIEWVRVATTHAEHRCSQVVDKDDVLQAARLLLPGVDCPVRIIGTYDDKLYARKQMDESECARLLKTDLAFRMLTCGRTDLVPHALQLLPPTRVNTINEQGLTPLMLACMQGDEAMVHILLDAGADVDIETPPVSHFHPRVNQETQHWTALTYATIQGHLAISKLLLEKGAHVEGGARLSEDKITETPLQLATASGRVEMVNLLLFYGANQFLSTTVKDSLSFGGAAQRGCYSAIAVAAAHGQRAVLHKLLAHPVSKSSKEVLSLEEILAEGASQLTSDRRQTRLQLSQSGEELNRNSSCSETSNGLIKLSRTQLKALQEAMYHSAENGQMEITLDLRNIGVPWTLHCWMHTLATAHELHMDNVIDQLLQDFLQVWPEDSSNQFVEECLPLLFTIFRHSKVEGTTLLLADIFSSCYGKEPIKSIPCVSIMGGARIDPKYVNNPEMSDVQFRVEGRVFYAHKIILVNASARFRSMLTAKSGDGSAPVVQINDISYEIFQLVMQYLYKGGCEGVDVDQNFILELLAAANFFQLDGLLRFCESRCTKIIDADSIVSIYVHAKAYNAAHLLEYCQGFLLQNMVSLLTYDDSVRKLIFGKKLHNHDVLSGLLLTLQARIKERCQLTKPNASLKSA